MSMIDVILFNINLFRTKSKLRLSSRSKPKPKPKPKPKLKYIVPIVGYAFVFMVILFGFDLRDVLAAAASKSAKSKNEKSLFKADHFFSYNEWSSLSRKQKISYIRWLREIVVSIETIQSKNMQITAKDVAKDTMLNVANSYHRSIISVPHNIISILIGESDAFAWSATGCIYAGWPSKTNANGRCKFPDSADATCQASGSSKTKMITCNPMLFGEGLCVPIAKDASAQCRIKMQSSNQTDETIMSKIQSENSVNFDKLQQTMSNICSQDVSTNSNFSKVDVTTCNVINNRIKSLGAAIKLPEPKSEPKSELKPPETKSDSELGKDQMASVPEATIKKEEMKCEGDYTSNQVRGTLLNSSVKKPNPEDIVLNCLLCIEQSKRHNANQPSQNWLFLLDVMSKHCSENGKNISVSSLKNKFGICLSNSNSDYDNNQYQKLGNLSSGSKISKYNNPFATFGGAKAKKEFWEQFGMAPSLAAKMFCGDRVYTQNKFNDANENAFISQYLKTEGREGKAPRLENSEDVSFVRKMTGKDFGPIQSDNKELFRSGRIKDFEQCYDQAEKVNKSNDCKISDSNENLDQLNATATTYDISGNTDASTTAGEQQLAYQNKNIPIIATDDNGNCAIVKNIKTAKGSDGRTIITDVTLFKPGCQNSISAKESDSVSAIECITGPANKDKVVNIKNLKWRSVSCATQQETKSPDAERHRSSGTP